MKKIEKFLNKQLDDNKDGINAVMDSFTSSLNLYEKQAEDEISTANLEIQKRMTNLANSETEESLNEMYNNFIRIEEAQKKIDIINQIRNFLFEEVQIRNTVKGLKK